MKGFVSYCHHDYQPTERLRTHLSAVERGLGIEFWWDERISPGTFWNADIARAIGEADVVVLAITPDFIASRYIYDVELPAIRNRVRAHALLVPVVIKKCSWDFVSGPVQAVPTVNAVLKPIDEWRNEDGFDRACAQIREAITTRFGVKFSPFKW
jgi:hypothetical protein